MWIFNTNALICGFGGFAGFLIAVKWSDNRDLSMFIAIFSAMLVDAIMRFTNDEVENPGINPEAGGHVWFLPVWAVGIILSIIGGLAYFNII